MDWLSKIWPPVLDSIVYSAVGMVILIVSFWIIELILPFSVRKEIEEDENTSLGIILGAFIIGILRNGCVLYDIPNTVQDIVVGAIIIAAAAIDHAAPLLRDVAQSAHGIRILALEVRLGEAAPADNPRLAGQAQGPDAVAMGPPSAVVPRDAPPGAVQGLCRARGVGLAERPQR